MHPGMDQLDQRLRAVPMNRPTHLSQTGDDHVAPQPRLGRRVVVSVLINRSRPNDDHANPTLGALLVVSDGVSVGDMTEPVIGHMRPKDDPIPNRESTDLKWRKEALVSHDSNPPRCPFQLCITWRRRSSSRRVWRGLREGQAQRLGSSVTMIAGDSPIPQRQRRGRHAAMIASWKRSGRLRAVL